MNILIILVILFITNVNVIQPKNLNNEPFIPDPYDSFTKSTKSTKSSQNNDFIEPYDIIRNYRKLDDLRKNLIDHNLIEHMIKSGGIDMIIRFLKN